MPDGVPEIGYPSHNPMYYEYNYTFGIQVVVLKEIFTVFDCNYYGIPDFEISLTQNSEDSAEVADAKWSDVTDTNGTDVETSGKMNYLKNANVLLDLIVQKGDAAEEILTKFFQKNAQDITAIDFLRLLS